MIDQNQSQQVQLYFTLFEEINNLTIIIAPFPLPASEEKYIPYAEKSNLFCIIIMTETGEVEGPVKIQTQKNLTSKDLINLITQDFINNPTTNLIDLVLIIESLKIRLLDGLIKKIAN